ncbi:tRNA (adenosine(37)-N6)-threonylcarbamoyltransferase complex dimerization subunit type 1 TsaB [Candidatus Margulisiibacteriota bacterium]
MKCLGISTAGSVMSAAIVTDGDVSAEFSVSGGSARTEKLVPMVDAVLKKADLAISKIEGIAVVKGPGSYSGLRGGLAAAKSFAETLKVPIVGISTLEAIAYNFINSYGTIAVLVHACKDEYNIALFASNGKALKRLTDDLVVKFDRSVELFSQISGKLILAAEEKLYNEILRKNKSSQLELADPKNIIPWAVNAAKIGVMKFRSGEKEDHLTISPEYSHKPNIREYKS